MAFFGAASSTTANVSSSPEKDIEVADPPPDSISSLSFCPVADFLAVGSWDNNVSCFCFVPLHLSSDDSNRCEYMRWGRMDRRKERQCMGTRRQFCQFVGIK